MIKENADGNENTFTYDENDELKTSNKFINGEQIKTTYSYDLYGNRLEKKDNGSFNVSHYNDKNQLSSIDTEKGTTYLHYDDIGNIASIYYDDGFIERYDYDDFGQLTQIKNNEDKTITYNYDALGERIDSKIIDEEAYQVKSYYSTEEELDLKQLQKDLTEENIDATFDALTQQAEIKENNGNSCTIKTDHYNIDEYKNKDAYTEYVIDRSQEFSQLLMENADTSIYGLARLETEDTKYINGLNNTTNQTITNNKVSNIEYEDYGYTEDITKGLGYNGEQQDQTGLIYLRARYYNPKLGRFIQIDPYKGSDNTLESKNRYTFVYNNPYKYVDMSGNEPLDPDDDSWKPRRAPPTLTSAYKDDDDYRKKRTKKTTYDPNSPANTFIRSANTTYGQNTPLIGEENRSVVWTDTQSNRTLPDTSPYFIPRKPEPVPCPKPLAEKSYNEMTEAERREWVSKYDKYGEKINDPYASSVNFLSWLDDLLDPLLRAGAYIVLGAGLIALAAGALVLSPAIGTATAAGVTLSSIAASSGTVAIVGGSAVVAGSTVQIASGVTGYKLDGEKLSETEAQQRIQDGTYNATTALTGMQCAYAGAFLVSASNSKNTETNTDWYVGPDGTVADSLDAYDDFIRMKGMSKSEIVNQVINGERIGSGLKGDIYHRAASFLSKEQLMSGDIMVFGGNDTHPYIRLTTHGTLNDKPGIFEYILNSKGQVTHQLFTPD